MPLSIDLIRAIRLTSTTQSSGGIKSEGGHHHPETYIGIWNKLSDQDQELLEIAHVGTTLPLEKLQKLIETLQTEEDSKLLSVLKELDIAELHFLTFLNAVANPENVIDALRQGNKYKRT